MRDDGGRRIPRPPIGASSRRRGKLRRKGTALPKAADGAGAAQPAAVTAALAARRATYLSPTLRIARNASCGISTLPTAFMRFLPAFCFSSSLRLRVMSPP